MLIKCPECNREISDKSDKCIHCGYPIRDVALVRENIMGKEVDVSFLLNSSVSQAKQIKQLVDLTGCDLFEAKEIVLKYHPTEKQYNLPHCPNCNSTNIRPISGLSRGASVAMLGIFSKKINKSYECLNCKYTW